MRIRNAMTSRQILLLETSDWAKAIGAVAVVCAIGGVLFFGKNHIKITAPIATAGIVAVVGSKKLKQKIHTEIEEDTRTPFL